MLYPIELWVRPRALKFTGRAPARQVVFARNSPPLFPSPFNRTAALNSNAPAPILRGIVVMLRYSKIVIYGAIAIAVVWAGWQVMRRAQPAIAKYRLKRRFSQIEP